MQDNRKGSVWVVIGIVILAIIIILFFVWRPGSVPAGAPSYAQQGQLASGFPKDLVLDSAAQIQNSYSIYYSQSGSQYVAEWDSSNSPHNELMHYDSYLSAHQWIIKDEQDGRDVKSLYAANGSSSLNFTASLQNGSTHVVLSYTAAQ